MSPSDEASPRGASPWQRAGLIAGVLVALAIALLPNGLHRIPDHGSRPAYAAAVAAMMAIWWLTEALPIAVTACVPLVFFPLLGVFGTGPVGDVSRSVQPFFDAYIFLFLGGMAIGGAMEQWNLHRRIALAIMRAIGTEPKRLLAGMLIATAAISLWISNTATAVMMMPIGLALVKQLEAVSGRRLVHLGGSLMLAVAYASNVGGIGTKIGTGTNSIFCGFLTDKLQMDIGFLEYMALGVPFVILFLPIVWVALWLDARKDVVDTSAARVVLDREVAALGPMSAGERKVAAVFAIAAALWILGDPIKRVLAPLVADATGGWKLQGKHCEATIAMLAAFALLAMGALSLAAVRRLPWGTLLLLGGSFAMASGIEGSGLSRWMALQLGGLAELPLWQQVGLASAATVGLSAVASNTATVNVALNVLPRSMPVLSATAIAASCDFMLPAGTPPNAIVFGSGYVRLPTMIRVGFFLDVAAVIFTTVYVLVYAQHLRF
jgi:solute carrier family 13 (sodium-dependent dicarboxylate transporter), member 2/3/5